MYKIEHIISNTYFIHTLVFIYSNSILCKICLLGTTFFFFLICINYQLNQPNVFHLKLEVLILKVLHSSL